MNDRIVRRVRAGRPAPTDLPPMVSSYDLVARNTGWRRNVRALIPYAFAVVVMLVGGAFALVIALGGKL